MGLMAWTRSRSISSKAIILTGCTENLISCRANKEDRSMRLSVIGLGKLGAPLAALFASKGHHVVGVDISAECVRMLASGRAPVEEPHLQQLIDGNQGRLTATMRYQDAVLARD